MKKYLLQTVRSQFKSTKKLFLFLGQEYLILIMKIQSFIDNLIINYILFITFTSLIIILLVFILTILSAFIGEEFNPIKFFFAFYNMFNFSWIDLFVFNFDNLIRGYYVDGVYVVNPFGLILFSSSVFLTSACIDRFKSHIFK